MSDIYLIRHTTPSVAKGTCYGQTDLDVTASFSAEADIIRDHLPAVFASVYSSPLQRCARLAQRLFPEQQVTLHPELMEIHCGEWEMRGWDDLPKEELDPWMKNFVGIRIPGGESYADLHARVTSCFDAICTIAAGHQDPVAIVAHGGVLRSILSHITQTPLIDSFKVFSLYYGCVVRLYSTDQGLRHEVLSNIPPPEKEQHKPKSFY